MTSLLTQLQKLHDACEGDRSRSRWLVDGPVEAYMRCSYLYDGLSRRRALVFANVVISDSSQRKGLFTKLLSEFTAWAKEHEYEAVVIENSNNSNLWSFLERQGFKRKQEDALQVASGEAFGLSFYKDI